MGRLDIVKARDWNPNQRQAKTRHTVVHRWMKKINTCTCMEWIVPTQIVLLAASRSRFPESVPVLADIHYKSSNRLVRFYEPL